MNRRTQVQRCRSSQRGFLAVCVLACLAIAATTMAITVRCTLQARRNTRLEHQMLQTEWLLDAGVHRAQATVNEQPDFEAESWTPAGPLQDLGNATVRIEVDRTAEDAPTVRVTATIIESSARARKTQRSYQFNLPPYSPDTSTAE